MRAASLFRVESYITSKETTNSRREEYRDKRRRCCGICSFLTSQKKMASRYYYELPVDRHRPAGYEGDRDHGRVYYPNDAAPVTFQSSSDPRSHHMTRDHHLQGAPAATSYDHGYHGSATVQDPYRRDWRDQGREGRSVSGYGVAPVEQVLPISCFPAPKLEL